MLVGRALRRLWATRYPGFVFGRPLPRGEVPVFVYHEVDRETFSADLAFLRNNGYRTLTADEFMTTTRDGSGGPKAVLLTFDDARRNFADVALPVLRDFGARATLFVPTHWIGGRRDATGQPETSAHDRSAFMTWEQVREARDSGLVDVQSHAHRHALVYTADRLVGFASPRSLAWHDIYDWPMRREDRSDTLGRPPLGTPIYSAEPLLSAERRVLEHPDAVRACRALVESSGGASFFDRRDWSSRLHAAHRAAYRPGERVEGEPFDALVASEFTLSRQSFEDELGYRPRFLAFPWMLGSETALDCAARSGMEAVFGVGIDFGRARRVTRPRAFGRLKSDWLRCMPGRGRRTLWKIIPHKARRFFAGQHLAH